MNVLSLFSGGGLGDLGLTLAGMEIVGQVEIDEYCQEILQLRYPESVKWKDIREVTGEEVQKKCGAIDLVAGGFPCQPFGVAGNQGSHQDDRYLWPEMLRIIQEVKPTFVLGENVPGIINLAIDDVLDDLENAGYSTGTFVFPAHACGAPHRRDRVWIVGYAEHDGRHGSQIGASTGKRKESKTRTIQAKQPAGSGVKHEAVGDASNPRTERMHQRQSH